MCPESGAKVEKSEREQEGVIGVFTSLFFFLLKKEPVQ